MKSTLFKFAALSAVILSAVACQPGRDAEARSANASPSANSGSTSTASAIADARTGSAAAFRLVTAPTGNVARYRIREQLAGLDLPNDAVGETNAVSGTIAVDSKGKIIPAESKFTVDVTGLKSDKDRRDGFVKRRVLETDQFPSVTLIPTAVRGISLPMPKSGRKTFELIGDLTVRGQTRPTTWKVDAEFQPGRMTGKAETSFTFEQFGISQPRVPVVLSVADTIKLELDFTMQQDGKR
jgi:polyisoprenoid-binding protein YceI